METQKTINDLESISVLDETEDLLVELNDGTIKRVKLSTLKEFINS